MANVFKKDYHGAEGNVLEKWHLSSKQGIRIPKVRHLMICRNWDVGDSLNTIVFSQIKREIVLPYLPQYSISLCMLPRVAATL